MPRKKLIRQNEFPYHISTRSNNKDWFSDDMDLNWNLFQKALSHAKAKCNVEIISYVLMSNHYHILMITPDSNIDVFMYHLNKKFSDLLRYFTNHINHKFGGRYNWCIVSTEGYRDNVFKYIYQNPVRAGLVNKGSDYKYSSYFKKSRVETIPILEGDISEYRDWLDSNYDEYSVTVIRNSSRKKIMSCPSRTCKSTFNKITQAVAFKNRVPK